MIKFCFLHAKLFVDNVLLLLNIHKKYNSLWNEGYRK